MFTRHTGHRAGRTASRAAGRVLAKDVRTIDFPGELNVTGEVRAGEKYAGAVAGTTPDAHDG